MSHDWVNPMADEVSRVIGYQDLVCGHQETHLDHDIGDFVIQRRDGVYSYQLACAVDGAPVAPAPGQWEGGLVPV